MVSTVLSLSPPLCTLLSFFAPHSKKRTWYFDNWISRLLERTRGRDGALPRLNYGRLRKDPSSSILRFPRTEIRDATLSLDVPSLFSPILAELLFRCPILILPADINSSAPQMSVGCHQHKPPTGPRDMKCPFSS